MHPEIKDLLTIFRQHSDQPAKLRGVIGIAVVRATNGGWSTAAGAEAATKAAIELIRHEERNPTLDVDTNALLNDKFVIDYGTHTSTWRAYRVRLLDPNNLLL